MIASKCKSVVSPGGAVYSLINILKVLDLK